MRNRMRLPVLAGVTLAIALGVWDPSVAVSGTKAYSHGNLKWSIHRWEFPAKPNTPTCGPQTTGFFPVPNPTLNAVYPLVNFVSRQNQGFRFPPPAGAEPVCPACGAGDVCFDYVIQSVSCFQNKMTVFDKAAFDAIKPVIAEPQRSGGPEISAAGDTAYASDSISVDVVRTAGTVTLNVLSGELKHDSGTSSDKRLVRSIVTVACYPDSNTAKLDVNNTGVGSNFFGKILFQQSKVLQLSGGFVAGDFIRTQTPDGANVVRPAAGLSKIVSVANSTQATVVIAIDELVDDDAVVPGLSPFGIGLLSLLLLAGGLSFVAARTRRA